MLLWKYTPRLVMVHLVSQDDLISLKKYGTIWSGESLKQFNNLNASSSIIPVPCQSEMFKGDDAYNIDVTNSKLLLDSLNIELCKLHDLKSETKEVKFPEGNNGNGLTFVAFTFADVIMDEVRTKFKHFAYWVCLEFLNVKIQVKGALLDKYTYYRYENLGGVRFVRVDSKNERFTQLYITRSVLRHKKSSNENLFLGAILMTLCKDERIDMLVIDRTTSRPRLIINAQIEMEDFESRPDFKLSVDEFDKLSSATDAFFDQHTFIYNEQRGIARDRHYFDKVAQQEQKEFSPESNLKNLDSTAGNYFYRNSFSAFILFFILF